MRSNYLVKLSYLKCGSKEKNNYFFSLILIMVLIINSSAQTSNVNFNDTKRDAKLNTFVQIKFDYGGIVPAVKEKGIDKYYALDLRVAWQKKENNIYSTIYRAPKFGFGFYSASFDNNVFGEPNGMYGFFEIPIGDQKKRLNWIYSIGAGLAFNFNYFDPENNPANELIGSNKNVYLAFSFEGRYNITEHWVAGLGFGFKHFSNGRITLPNSGINLIPLTVTTEYNFGDSYTDIQKGKLPIFIPFNMLNVFGAAGVKNFEYDGARYFKSTLSINALRQFSYKYRYGLGFDLFYTAGSLDRVTDEKNNFNKQYSYGFAGLFEWLITERLYLPFNFGIHLNKNEENFEELLYQRIGLRYLLGKQKKIMIGVGLKTTEFHADYVEWTLGYTFKNDKNKYELLF